MNDKKIKRRISFAYHLDGWSFENGDKAHLKKEADQIVPSDYAIDMDGSLFCPGCFTNLNRIPKERNHCIDGREAYFSHTRKYTNIRCDLKSSKPEGKRYESQKEAQKAIDDENLVVVSGFIKKKPEIGKPGKDRGDEIPGEDLTGKIVDTPISRHKGESFQLPSRIKTINGICRDFNKNLYKYYLFPKQSNARRLIDLLHNIKDISRKIEKPKLYYGRITKSVHMGMYPEPHNIRMTYLESHREVKDFTIKIPHQEQEPHGIGDDSVGRIVIIYGAITVSGIGLCFENLGWGEFALLPDKYNKLLP